MELNCPHCSKPIEIELKAPVAPSVSEPRKCMLCDKPENYVGEWPNKTHSLACVFPKKQG